MFVYLSKDAVPAPQTPPEAAPASQYHPDLFSNSIPASLFPPDIFPATLFFSHNVTEFDNNLHTNIELRDQFNYFQSNILKIQEQTQKLIDKGVDGAKTVCKNIVWSVNNCSNIKRAADVNIEKITPDGCTSYSLTRLVCNKKRAVLVGNSSTDTPHLRTQYVNISDNICIPLPLNSNVYSAVEACEILLNNIGKGTFIIQYMIVNSFIPVKKSIMYCILNVYKKSCAAEKNTLT